MKFVRYDETKLGVLTEDGIVDLTTRLELSTRDPLADYIRGDYDVAEYRGEPSDFSTDEVELCAPIHRPGKIIAAPGNYLAHQDEMKAVYEDKPVDWTIEDKGYFLKAPSSVIGPEGTIEIPFSDRRFDHEVELAFVMGEDVKYLDKEKAIDSVFGFTILLDISMRGDQDRSNRKSFDTFTVIGPWVVTPEEIGDPQNLDISLSVNGDKRQESNTSGMIYGCSEFVQYASIGTTLEAGDIVTTGTPPGVNQLFDGDRIEAEIENIGAFSVDVTVLDQTFDDIVG